MSLQTRQEKFHQVGGVGVPLRRAGLRTPPQRLSVSLATDATFAETNRRSKGTFVMTDDSQTPERFACQADQVFDGEKVLTDAAVLVEGETVRALVPTCISCAGRDRFIWQRA